MAAFETDESILIRTDFADDGAWAHLCDAIATPVSAFRAHVVAIDDRAHDGASVDAIVRLVADGVRPFVFVADRVALGDPEQRVLVVDLLDEPGRTFRVVPSEAWGVENNLSLANMDFAEFADAVGADGTFRGFRD